MSLGGYRHLPIVDQDIEPIGIISVKDVIDNIMEHFREEVLKMKIA